MCANYERLVREGTPLLEQLNPNSPEDSGNICPLTADAVDDFLNTGEINPVSNELNPSFIVDATWQRRTLPQIASRLRSRRNCNHVVVRGHRPENSQLTDTHFFVMMNVRGDVYIVDAWQRIMTQDLNGYQEQSELHHYYISNNFEARQPDVWEIPVE